MSTTDQFLIALQAYQDIQAELHQASGSPSAASEATGSKTPTLPTTSLPDGSLLMGLAEDGLPLLLDLYDPAVGPILVAGDGGSGKTALLQTLAHAADFKDPGEIQFGVLTPFPEEWTRLETLPNCMGIWPAYHPSAGDFLSQMVSWSESLPETRQVILLLVDGLDLMISNGFQSQYDLRWLLTYGPERQIWPVVSVNPGRLPRLQTWLEYFPTRIIGRINLAHNARLFLEDPQIDLAVLLPGTQFVLSQPCKWLKFTLLSLEEGD